MPDPSLTSLNSVLVVPREEELTPRRAIPSMLAELVKARLTALVLVTTLAGYWVARPGIADWLMALHVLLGTGLVASGAAALNEWWERDLDRLMERTARRPLPSGELEPSWALVLGLGLSLLGIGYLTVVVNELTALLGLAAVVSYVLVYTPLKRRTVWNTLIGAIPGALPPLMGWTAARAQVETGGMALFGVLLLWQLPHFMAIAWLYREQYAGAGYRMLPVIDPTGIRTAVSAVVAAVLLLGVSLVPCLTGHAGRGYGVGAALLGGGFIWASLRFLRARDRANARLMFFASILYLPALLGLLMLDTLLAALGG